MLSVELLLSSQISGSFFHKYLAELYWIPLVLPLRLHGAKNKEQIFAYLKTKGGIEGKLWYYRAFTDALRGRKEYPELAYELEIAVRELEQLIY